MKMYFSIVAFLFSCVFSATGQEPYSKIIDLYDRTTDAILNFALVDDRIYAGIGSRCDSSTVDCAAVVEFSPDGDTLWKRDIPWLDPGGRAIAKKGDTLMIAGQEQSLNHFYLYYLSSSGESIENINLYPPEGYSEMRIGGVFQYFDHTLVYGTSFKDSSDILVSLIYWLNSTGVIDTTLILEIGEMRTITYDLDIDPEGNLTALLELVEMVTDVPNPYLIRRKMLMKMNQQIEEIWSWQTGNEYPFSGNNRSRLAVLNDGTMVITAEDGSATNEEIWGVDEKGIKWKYKFPLGGWYIHNVADLIESNNGDILGCGQIFDGPSFEVHTGYLFRLNSQGELLWERAIIDDASEVNGNPNVGWFLDVVERDDGSIMAGGYQFVWYLNNLGQDNLNWDSWLVVTDDNGCIIEDCEYVQDIPTPTAVVPTPADITFYPNPANDFINITWPEELEISQVDIFNSLGQLVKSQFTKETSLHLLTQGMAVGVYYISLQDEQHRRYTEKVIIR